MEPVEVCSALHEDSSICVRCMRNLQCGVCAGTETERGVFGELAVFQMNIAQLKKDGCIKCDSCCLRTKRSQS
jgi:hypothetical protein